MPTATLPRTERPAFKIPANVAKSDVWYDKDGVLRQHAIELPVDPKTHKINGRLFACVVAGCPTAELVIEPATTLPEGKVCCPRDGNLLAYVPLDPDEADPVASGRQRQLAWLANLAAEKRARAAAAFRESAAMAAVRETRASAPEKLARLATDGKGHLPSLAASVAVEVGVIYTVDLADALQTAALAAAITATGCIAGYLIAVYAEKIRLWRRKEGFEGRAAKKARERGLWAGRASVSTGLFIAAVGVADAMTRLEPGNGMVWGVLALLGLGLSWWTNRDHWERLWAERRRLRELAAEKARRAAEASARLAEQEAAARLAEAQLREQLAQVGATDPDNPLHQGELMRIEWERISRLKTMPENFSQITRTKIVPDQTHEITAPDPVTGKKVRIGWGYLGTCEPGALVGRGGLGSPLQAAKDWLVAVLFEGQYDGSQISLVDNPDGRQNTFMIMITERARLGDAVPWRAETAVRVADDGTRYGYLGRSLTGDDLEEILYQPTQAFGGGVIGTTGGGKGGHATRHICNLLLALIFPVLQDPKRLVDYGDFVGMFPIGFTKRHRRMIMAFLHAERARRETKLAASPKTNRYGAAVAGESRWNTHDPATGLIGVYGQPIEHIWDEFHDQSKDQAFLADFCNLVRFERAAGLGVTLLSQGGGLDDFGNNTLRDLIVQTSLTMYRTGDLSSRLAGGRNQNYSTADLPMLPGMCLRQAPNSPRIPLRAAYITRDPNAEDTVYTTLWGKGAEPVLQIEDPLTWISEETIALMKDTGVWDLWMQARTYRPDGTWVPNITALLADDEEDEEGDEVAQALAQMAPKAMQPATNRQQQPSQTKMPARQVLMAILHETPGISLQEIYASDGWVRAVGWGKRPPDSTVTRAAKELDPTVGGTLPLPAGAVQKINRGEGSRSWTLTPAGAEEGAACAARLLPRQAPDSRVEPVAADTPAARSAMATFEAENATLQAAEMARILAEEARLATAHIQ